MLFTSHIFLFYFLPLTLAGYFLLPARAGWRNGWLLLMSYVFYGWLNPWFVLLMLAVTALNYLAGLGIVAAPTPAGRRAALVMAVTLSLGLLGFFKYAGFLQVNVNHLRAAVGLEAQPVWNILLPAGISFYVFQALTYVIDLHRGHAPPARSFADFACYIALFPQSIAGPIVRYRTMADDLAARRPGGPPCAAGIALFVLGLAKKVLLANPLGGLADAAFDARAPGPAAAWLGLVAYALQIYFDFCGYSDMAVGLGRLFGFVFPRNFDDPYAAASITEFWRRWHLSLSTFLRDYLYLPLGGNRGGPARTARNLALVMLLGGLWHGANWTYVVWGAWHGAWLIAERWAGRRPFYHRLPRPLRVACTLLLVLLSWVWFRAESLAAAGSYFAALFGAPGEAATAAGLAAQLRTPLPLVAQGVGAALLLVPRQAHDWSERITGPRAALLLALWVAVLAALATQTASPFLYFQF